MNKIWTTSDVHLNHDKDFIWGKRGFSDVHQMNKTIIERWNSCIDSDDIVFYLGDFIMGPLEDGINLVNQLKGKIYLAIGNHDTENRINAFRRCPNIIDIQMGYRIKIKKDTLLLTHYPTIVTNGEDNNDHIYNLYGHTHQNTNFYEDRYYMYHVGVDSHNGYPITIDHVLEDIKKKKKGEIY